MAKPETQRKVVRGLGLGKFGSSVIRPDSPTIRGAIAKISHLLTVEQVDCSECKTGKSAKNAGKEKKVAAKGKKVEPM